MPKPLRARLLRYALYFCAALLCSLLILLWQAPALTQRHLPAWLAKHYGLHLTLGEIDVGLRHPSLAIGPTTLFDDQQQPLVAFDRLQLTPLIGESWRQRALILDEALLVKPTVNLVRLADRGQDARFNLTEALASLLAPGDAATTDSGAPLLVQINRLAAEQGHITYQDSRKQSSLGWVPTLALSGLDLQLPRFSTAPGRANPFVLGATLNKQSPLKASGELDIMSGAGKGKISLGKLALTPFAPLWAPYLDIKLARGEANAELAYQITEGKQGLGWQLSKGKLTLNDWQLQRSKGGEFARFKQLALTGIALDGSKQALQIDRVTLKAPAVSAVLDANQQLDLATLQIPQPPVKTSKAAKPAAPAKPWRWSLKQTRIEQGQLKLTESSSGKPLLRELSALTLALGPLGSQSGQSSPLTLSGALNNQAKLDFDGDLALAPLQPKRRDQATGSAAQLGPALSARSAAHQCARRPACQPHQAGAGHRCQGGIEQAGAERRARYRSAQRAGSGRQPAPAAN